MKQYFTGFFTAFCLTASVFLFMGAQNKNLGDVTVKSLTVEDDEGRPMVSLSSFKLGGAIDVWNKDNQIVAVLSNSDNSGGIISTYNADDKQTSFLGTGGEGDGMLNIFDIDGKGAIKLGTGKVGGIMETYNTDGNQTTYLGTGKKVVVY